jgi:predicted nucleic-acid-binding Zn-ribbon protein
MVHYFRVKAGYMGKLSNYSNVFTYYSEDYINISCPKCKKTINYDDVMIDEDVILD